MTCNGHRSPRLHLQLPLVALRGLFQDDVEPARLLADACHLQKRSRETRLPECIAHGFPLPDDSLCVTPQYETLWSVQLPALASVLSRQGGCGDSAPETSAQAAGILLTKQAAYDVGVARMASICLPAGDKYVEPDQCVTRVVQVVGKQRE